MRQRDPRPATIQFNLGASATITLDSEIEISDDLNLSGSGALGITLSGTNSDRIFSISKGAVVIDNLRLSDGKVSDDGGAIHISGKGSEVLLSGCELIGNQAGARGGAIYIQDGVLTIPRLDYRRMRRRHERRRHQCQRRIHHVSPPKHALRQQSGRLRCGSCFLS